VTQVSSSMSPRDWVRHMPADPVASSEALGWRRVGAYRFNQPPGSELRLPPVDAHFVVAHLRNPALVNARLNGRWTRTRSNPGSIMIIPANHEVLWEWKGGLWELQLLLDAETLDHAAEEVSGRAVALADGIGIEDPELWDIARAAEREIAAPQPGTRLFADILSQRLALALLRRHSSAIRRPGDRPIRIARHKLQRALEFIEANLAEDVSLAAIAAAAGLSEAHFARGFKAATGRSPHRYLIERRLERARELLRGTSKRVAQIALECGFASHGHLTTVMRESCGITPRRYRVESDG
jgi:AraC family transcriptional regulator